MTVAAHPRERLKLGGKPSDPRKPRAVLRRRPGHALNPPAQSTGLSKLVPASAWGMLGNDQLGDCVCAGALHGQQLIDKAGKGVDTGFTTQDAISMYEVVGGYVPGRPNTDQGAELIDGLKYWAQGLGSSRSFKADAYAQFDIKDTDLLKQLINDFGVVYLALEVPESAMTQFDAGQPWTVVKRSPIEGGHCVPGVDYDENYLYVVTWASVQAVSWDFVAKYFDEGWAVTSADLVKAAGGSIATGIDTDTANSDWQSLTGDTSSPFPASDPTPTPTPDPTPAPDGTVQALLQEAVDGLAQAIAAAQAWVAKVTTWLAANPADDPSDVPPHRHGH
jgi:hypothetical protein